MAGGLSVNVQLSPAWRDAAGRFARPPVGNAIAARLPQIGRDALPRLQRATPVRTGAMQAGWRSAFVPTAQQLRISNLQPYWAYVVWGTSRQPANPALQQVIREDLPALTRTTADAIGRAIVLDLGG